MLAKAALAVTTIDVSMEVDDNADVLCLWNDSYEQNIVISEHDTE